MTRKRTGFISRAKARQGFIVKVQRPLVSNSQDPPALIYNENRSVIMYYPMDAELKRILGTELKVYWWAHIEGDTLHLDKPAEEQDW
jgi:hypothetical protein